MPEHLAGTVAKLPLVSDRIVGCKVSVAEEVNEGGVAGGVVDRVNAAASFLEDQLDVGSVLREERRSSASTSISLLLRLLLCCQVQLCDAREGILITQVLHCWGQVPETRSFESYSWLSILPQRVAEREIDDCLVVSVFSCVVIVFSQRSQAHILIREDAQRLDASTFLLCDHNDEQVAKKSQQAQGRRPHPETAALVPPCLKPES